MSDPITKNAGVIVTFYCPRGEVSGLTQTLGQQLGLVRAKFGFAQDLSASHQDIYLRHFDPVAAYDTTIVQLALSETGDASSAWETLRQKLEQLNLSNILDEFVKNDAIWGYTLVYQAVLVEGATLDEQQFKHLLRAARRPGSPKREDVEVLAHTRFFGHVWDDFSQTSLAQLTLQQFLSALSNGIEIYDARSFLDSNLWLLDIPNEGDGIEAATVYIALSRPDKEDELISKILYGPSAALLMPDLIAHKAYHQKRQYAAVLDEETPDKKTPDKKTPDKKTPDKKTPDKKTLRKLYRKQIDDSHEIIDNLLGFSSTSDTINGQSGLDEQLKRLSKAYKVLLGATPFFENLRLSLAQQVENYEWWKEQLGQGNLADYHYKQMQMAYREVDLLIGKGESTLNAIGTTRDLIQTQLDEAGAKREKRLELLIAFLGIALAVAQFVNFNLSEEVFAEMFEMPFSPLELYVATLIVPFVIQILITLWLTLALFSLYRLYRLWRGKANI